MSCKFIVIFKVVVNIISIMVYTMVLSISWKYVASLHIVPNPWCSKCVATYMASLRLCFLLSNNPNLIVSLASQEWKISLHSQLLLSNCSLEVLYRPDSRKLASITRFHAPNSLANSIESQSPK